MRSLFAQHPIKEEASPGESETHRERLEDAILHGKRDEYLQILERRKEKNIRTLQKRFGITV